MTDDRDEVTRRREARDLSLTRHPSQTALESENREGVPHPAAWTGWSQAERALWNLGVHHAARHLSEAWHLHEIFLNGRRQQLQVTRESLEREADRARDPRRGIALATLPGLLEAAKIVTEALDRLDRSTEGVTDG